MTMKLTFLPMMMVISTVAVAARFQRLVGKCNNQQFKKTAKSWKVSRNKIQIE